MIKKLTLLVLGTSLVGLLHAGSAAAAFNANNLIDDGVFDRQNSMTASQINSWLNTNFPNSCISTNNGFSSPDPTGFTPSSGFTYGSNVSAGQVIVDAGLAYGLNPQVILATLEKESSVVTGNASYRCTYINTAMGYDCPDSGSCPQNPAKESGFSKQVIYATWMLKFHEQRSEGNINWNVTMNNSPQPGDVWDNSDDPQSCYGGRVTQGNRQVCPGGATNYYDGYTTIDSTSVHLDTGATAALYDYTPHFHGNQNFVSIFESWFGPTTGSLMVGDNPSDQTVYLVDGATKYPISSQAVFSDFGSMGPLQHVTSAFLSSNYPTTGPVLGHIIGASDGSLYYVTASIRLWLPDCGKVTDYGGGGSCTPNITLSDSLLSKLASGPAVVSLIKSPSNGTIYYMSSGKKRPIPSWIDLTNLNLPISYNVFSNASTNDFPTGNLMYGPGSLVKTSGSGTVYLVKSTNEMFSISSFMFAHELGVTSTLRTMTDSTLNDYSVISGLQNKIQCSSSNYVGIDGSLYQVSSTMMDASHYNYSSANFLPGSTLCSSLGISGAKQLIQYIRTADGTIYYVSSGQKHALTSYSIYQAHQTSDGKPGYISSSDFFASSLPSGTNISS